VNPLARLVLPALRWRAGTGFRHERRRIEATLDLGIGGYILFGGDAATVRALTRDVAAAAPHPLLFASDLERGAGQQFPDLTHLPPPAALGFIGRTDITARCAEVTAVEARSVGLNWVYAPVADLDAEAENPMVQTPRASLVALFGHPRLVAAIGGDVPVVCAWHGQPLMQRAAARWVPGRLR
jgi:beta-glucosidase